MDRFDLASVTGNIQTPINQTQQFYMETHSTLHEEDRGQEYDAPGNECVYRIYQGFDFARW